MHVYVYAVYIHNLNASNGVGAKKYKRYLLHKMFTQAENYVNNVVFLVLLFFSYLSFSFSCVNWKLYCCWQTKILLVTRCREWSRYCFIFVVVVLNHNFFCWRCVGVFCVRINVKSAIQMIACGAFWTFAIA